MIFADGKGGKMEQVEKFLKEADVYYLATMEGDQPRVRPFGTAHIFEGKPVSYTHLAGTPFPGYRGYQGDIQPYRND